MSHLAIYAIGLFGCALYFPRHGCRGRDRGDVDRHFHRRNRTLGGMRMGRPGMGGAGPDTGG